MLNKKMSRFLAVIALLVFASGCASTLHETENLAIAAGFKVITPSQPDQVAMLSTLAHDKVTQVQHTGKTYYVLPDVKNNQAYVGGPKQYEAYQKLRLDKEISNQNLMAAEMNEDASWGEWGGWGEWDGPGWNY
jgi:hypothetical protein